MSDTDIWIMIVTLGIGTFLIRYSFLGLVGRKPMPPVLVRHLRYAAVAVLPGLVTPLVVWPQATGGSAEPARILAAVATLAVGLWTRNVLWAMGAGALALYGTMGLMTLGG